jgi:hypothetical protein
VQQIASRRVVCAVIAVAIGTAACTERVARPPSISHSGFSGTLESRSSRWHHFTVHQDGVVTVKLTSLGTSGHRVGLGVGRFEAGCERIAWNTYAHAEDALSLTTSSGAYCVFVYDSGGLEASGVLAPAAYTLSVDHP